MTGADTWGGRKLRMDVGLAVSCSSYRRKETTMNITLHQRTADRAKVYTDDPALPLTGKATSVPTYSEARPVGKARRWTGRIASGLAIAFLLFDAIPKILLVAWVVKATTELGFPLGAIRPIGLILLTCTVLYCVPRTAILGAVLLTGYLGGAVEANV